MAVKSYNYNDKTQLTKHFNVQEFKCKCGKNHEIKIDDKLPILLENLIEKLGAEHGNIYSGYRCPEYDKKVGGRGTGSHTLGYSVDIYFKGPNNKIYSSSEVSLTLEDMKHNYGIGYRAGGSLDYQGKIHIDTRPRKWYGDESISNTLAIWDIKKGCYSFYDYLGIPKETPRIGTVVSRDESKEQIEVLIDNLYARNDPNGTVLGFMKKGIYNILETRQENNYLWVRVGVNIWFATKNDDWTKYYPILIIDEPIIDSEPIIDIPVLEDEEVIDLEEDIPVLEFDEENNEENDNVFVKFIKRIYNFLKKLFT